MAQCPCNCGRKVPFNRGGAATGYRRVSATLDEFGDIAQVIEKHGSDPSEFLATRGEGTKIAQEILDHVHKDAHPLTHRSLLDLVKDIQRWDARWQLAVDRAADARPDLP